MSATPPPMLPPPRTATSVSPPPMTLSTAMALRTPSPVPMAATTAWSISRSPSAAVLARAAPRTASAASTAVAPSVCYRHRPDVRAKEPRVDLDALLQQLPASAQTQVAQMWSSFAASSSRVRETILLGLLDACCMPQLTIVSRAIAPVMKMDLISQLPMELALRVLQYLDAKSLCRAAQVSKAWALLANDDVLWHRMCLQHIDKRCTKCGWGLPMLSRKRKRTRCSSDSSTTGVAGTASSSSAPGPSSAASSDGKSDARPALTSSSASTSLSRAPPAPTSCGGQMPIVSTIPVSALLNPPSSDDNDDSDDDDDAMRACLDQPPLKRAKRSSSVAPGSIHGSSAAVPERQGMTRHVNGPTDTAVNALHRNRRRKWKAVYAERLIIERNWRRNSHLVFPLVPPTASLQPRITACHLDEPFLMTSSMDGLVRLWNLETRTCVQTLAGHRGAVTGVHFDEAKGLALSGGLDGTVRIWNYTTGACVRVLAGGHHVPVTALHFDAGVLATADASSQIRVWDFEAKSCFTLNHGNLCVVTRVVLCKGYLYSAGEDGVVRMFDLNTRSSIRTFLPLPESATAATSSVAAAAAAAAAASAAGTAPGALGSPAVAQPHAFTAPAATTAFPGVVGALGGGAAPMAVSPAVTSMHVANVHVDGGHAVYVLTGSADGRVHVYCASEPTAPASRRTGRVGYASAADAFAAAAAAAAAAQTSNSSQVVRPRMTLHHGAPITSVWFDSLRILSCGTDGAVHLWDMASGERLRSFPVGGTAGVVTGSDTRIVCAREDGVVHVWDFGQR